AVAIDRKALGRPRRPERRQPPLWFPDRNDRLQGVEPMRNLNMYRRCGAAFLLTLALAITPVSAQPERAKQKPQSQKKAPALPPVAVINNPAPEYRSGEVSVAVRGNENPIIRLGLAPNGVTLVEFPASDNFFAINPGANDLVTIEDSPTKETD